MAFNPFITRQARVTVTVTRPNSAGAPTNFTYVWTQNRMRLSVREGGQQFGNLKAEIYGVPLSDMNQIARLWLEQLTPQNTDTITVDVWNGNANGWMPWYQGVIAWAAVNARGMPITYLEIESNSAFVLSNTTALPYSNSAPVTLRDALTSIAALGGFTVNYASTLDTYVLQKVRLTGSPLQQIGELMRHFPELTWNARLQQIVVRAANAPLSDAAVRIAVDTGMESFPVYSTSALTMSTLFNPQIYPGVALDVVVPALQFVDRTLWVAAVLSHQIEPNYPKGRWMTDIAANSFGPKGNGN